MIALSCTDELTELKPVLDSDKVTVDFTVLIPEGQNPTKAFGDNPNVRNLYLAVFDENRFLVEYVKADPLQLASTNETRYKYSVTLTLSDTKRIIHFIANAPETIRYGRDEEVITSLYTSGTNDAYWYRKEIDKIKASNPDASTLTPTQETIDALSEIPLVRNFAKIVVQTAADCDFELTSYAVFNTPTQGSIAAYNRSKGEFVDYPGKSFETLIGKEEDEEGYDAFVPGSAELNTEVNVNAFKTTPAYVYERETPINNPAYVLVYGTYGGKNVYYKVDLRDQSGKYFPILRNFQYTVTINSVTRDGYPTPEDAVKYGGSGDISTSVDENIVSLTNISDGEVRLSVEYTSKVLVTEDNVPLWYKFETLGDAELDKVTIKLADDDKDALSGIGREGSSATESMIVDEEPVPNAKKTIVVNPAQIGAAQKTGSLLIIAEYILNGSRHTIQRKVSYTLTAPYEMEIKCVPGEVDKKINEAFDLNITIPDGLGSSMFPLAFNIEAQNLSITPDNDNLPVTTGISNIPNANKSAFWFVKYLTKEEYYALPVVSGKRTVQCHFKTNKAESATNIYVTNTYFVAYVNDILPSTTGLVPYDVDYLGNYSRYFENLRFSGNNKIPTGVDKRSTVSFELSEIPQEGFVNVTVTLINAKPANDETRLVPMGTDANGNPIFSYIADEDNTSFDIITRNENGSVEVKLEASHFAPASATATRGKMSFAGKFVDGNGDEIDEMDPEETVFYEFTGYTAGTAVTVTFNGLAFADGMPNDGQWTQSGNSYTFTPNETDITTIKLVATTEQDENSVTLSATDYESLTSTIEQINAIIIPAGKLVMTLSGSGMGGYATFSNGGTITMYTSNGTQIAAYTYTRSNNNRTATNNQGIELQGVTGATTVYVTYSVSSMWGGTTTYKSANFTVNDAIDENGVTSNLQN